MENSIKEFGKYAGMSVLGMTAISCYILADTFFVSKSLGTGGLAALNLAIPIYNFIHGTGLMLGMGGATRFTICKSCKDQKGADEMFTNTVWLGLICSVLFAAAGFFGSEAITRLLGADSAVFSMSNTYLKVLLFFAPAFIFNDILLCFVRNDGNPGLAMNATIAGSLSNIVLDYVFMFPLGMGIFGAVFATGLSPVIGILLMSPHWMKKEKGFHPVRMFLRAEPVGRTLSLGFPSLFAQLSSGIVMIVFNILILGISGNTGVAAYGVVANISLVVVSIHTGIAQGIQPLVSREYGKREERQARRFFRYGVVTMLALSAVLYLTLFVFAGPIARIFNSEGDPMLQQIAVAGLKLYFLATPFVGYNLILSTYFTSEEKAFPAQLTSLLRGLVLILPLAFLLSGAWGMTGIWLVFPATEFLAAVLGVWMDLRLNGTTRIDALRGQSG